MARWGIYTLANDAVYDQLVALLNSIEIWVGATIPICIIPFDAQIERVRQEVTVRSQVSLFDNWNAIAHWQQFATQVWSAYPKAQRKKLAPPGWYQCHLERKFAAFDGPFERFIFLDADSLVMKPLDGVIQKLDQYDFVFDDWEHRKTGNQTALDLAKIQQAGAYRAADVQSKLHCSSFFASKRQVLTAHDLAGWQDRLIIGQEVSWIREWWDDAQLFNYLTLRSERPLFNYTQSPNPAERTGNCAGADPFVAQIVDQQPVLYNQDGLKPIHRLHYMSYRSRLFTRLCQGEAVNIPHRDVFLHYRYWHQPEQYPLSLRSPSWFEQAMRQADHGWHRLTCRTRYLWEEQVSSRFPPMWQSLSEPQRRSKRAEGAGI